MNQIPLDWENNLQNIRSAIHEARLAKVDLLCLPELSICGYGCEDLFLSDWLPAKSLEKLEELLPDTSDIAVVVGLPIKFENFTYNAVALIENKRIKGIYAKHNLANEGVHYEPRWFRSWPYEKIEALTIVTDDIPFGAITETVKGVKIGFEICEDAWQEDRPACNLVKKGVELILNPSASHFAFGKETFRENLVIESSEKFDCVYLYTNLLGNEAGRMIYDGDIIISQKGKLIGHNKRFSFRNYNLLWLDVDFDNHTSSLDVREDFQSKMQEFSHAVPLALFDYCRKSRSKGFVLSLSGGADSSAIAVLIAQMVQIGVKQLGTEDFLKKIGISEQLTDIREIVSLLLTTAYQGTKNSSQKTLDSAENLAKSIGAQFNHWSIDEEIESYSNKISSVIGRDLSWETDDIALQNIQARGRSPIIWMLANIKNCILLTTSNRSEGDVGYATMDGDTSGSVAPIAGVDKSFILQWLKYAESELGFEGLSEVNKLQPSAELRPLEQSQTDEDDLMPYTVLTSIERLAIRDRLSPVQVYDRLSGKYPESELKAWIKKFYRLWSFNQWKRERIALSFHIDDFNVDPRTWCRFPILSGAFKEELDQL